MPLLSLREKSLSGMYVEYTYKYNFRIHLMDATQLYAVTRDCIFLNAFNTIKVLFLQ
jgi:hypothetical protein